MIMGVYSLIGECKECEERADFKVERTNDDLPERAPSGIKYFRKGTRVEYYCKAHLPEEVKVMWSEEENHDGLADAGLIKRTEF